MQNQIPNPLTTEDKLTQFLANPNSYYTLVIMGITEPRYTNTGISVKFKFTNSNQTEVLVDMDLDDFFVFDNFTLVYLIRYAFNKNDPKFFKRFLNMVEEYDMRITELKKKLATKFLQQQFFNPKIDFDGFIVLLEWHVKNPRLHTGSLINQVHCQFLHYIKNLYSAYMYYHGGWIHTTQSQTGLEDLESLLSHVMSASCSSYPILMMANQSLTTAYNFRQVLCYDQFNQPQHLHTKKQISPRYMIGEYAVLYFHFKSQQFFKDLLQPTPQMLTPNGLIELNFENRSAKDYETQIKGSLLQTILTLYQSMIDLKMLNPFERKIYLRFADKDKVAIFLQGNQVTTAHIAQAMPTILENISHLSVYKQFKFLMLAFSNGLNAHPEKNYYPFVFEMTQLRCQMFNSLEPYELLSDEKFPHTHSKIQKINSIEARRYPQDQKLDLLANNIFYDLHMLESKHVEFSKLLQKRHDELLQSILKKYLNIEIQQILFPHEHIVVPQAGQLMSQSQSQSDSISGNRTPVQHEKMVPTQPLKIKSPVQRNLIPEEIKDQSHESGSPIPGQNPTKRQKTTFQVEQCSVPSQKVPTESDMRISADSDDDESSEEKETPSSDNGSSVSEISKQSHLKP